MRKVIMAGLISLALAGAAHAFGLGLGNRFGHLGAAGAPGVAAPPPTCSPGGPTGQMDFSVCSNIAITAAAF